MRTFWQGFFWGPPSHRRVAWLGATVGLLVFALALTLALLGQGGHPLLLLAFLTVGLAELGWGIEVLPRHYVTLAGWGRVAQWSCAVIGLCWRSPACWASRRRPGSLACWRSAPCSSLRKKRPLGMRIARSLARWSGNQARRAL